MNDNGCGGVCQTFFLDDSRIPESKPRGEGLSPAFALQRHTTPTAGVLVTTAKLNPSTDSHRQSSDDFVWGGNLASKVPALIGIAYMVPHSSSSCGDVLALQRLHTKPSPI
ncbi:hypothetical protein TNCV_4011781 [Trichonephila clavipes]|nr:hypothetical protein TNCV_4011781 [Trichonephila clavipes]